MLIDVTGKGAILSLHEAASGSGRRELRTGFCSTKNKLLLSPDPF